MNPIHFVVPGPPMAWARAKVATKDRAGKPLVGPRFFEDKERTKHKYLINREANGVGMRVPDDCPGVVVTILAVFERTKSRPRYGHQRLWKSNKRFPCRKLRSDDADNLAKLVLDGISADGLKPERSNPCWSDDGIVSGLQCWRVYAGPDEEPRTEVWVREVSDGDWPFMPWDVVEADSGAGVVGFKEHVRWEDE